MSLEDITSKNR